MAIVTYTQSADPLRQLRIHVRTCSVMDMARYRRHLREVNMWAEERLGKPLAQLTDEELDAFEDDGTLPMFRIGQDRAEMLSALDGVEVRDGDGDWQAGEMPEAWQGIEGFAQALPATLYVAWREAVWQCNPGLFGALPGDAEKKSGNVSVTW